MWWERVIARGWSAGKSNNCKVCSPFLTLCGSWSWGSWGHVAASDILWRQAVYQQKGGAWRGGYQFTWKLTVSWLFLQQTDNPSIQPICLTVSVNGCRNLSSHIVGGIFMIYTYSSVADPGFWKGGFVFYGARRAAKIFAWPRPLLVKLRPLNLQSISSACARQESVFCR